MKFTSEDLMKAMRLQVGDRIKCAINEYTIVKINDEVFYEREGNVYSMVNLVNRDFEILPRPKRVGDLKCDDIPHSDCIICPIKILCLDYGDANKQLFYEILEDYKSKSGEHFDQEIYDLLKARLDKEVE